MSLDFNPVENGIQCRSHEKCKEGSERQTEHDGGGHTSEDDIEQQRHTSEYGGQGCHQYRTCPGYGSLDDGLLRSRSGTQLDVGFVQQYDDILDNHSQQSQPSGNAEEAELKSRNQQSEHHADEGEGQNQENDEWLAEIAEQPYQNQQEDGAIAT